MNLEARIKAFASLGAYLLQQEGDRSLEVVKEQAMAKNVFFTIENINKAIGEWARLLSEENIRQWLKPYNLEKQELNLLKPRVAIVMAGNIPLVGFHDFLSVLLSGKRVLVKLSSQDPYLLPFLSEKLLSFTAEKDRKILSDSISFTKDKLIDFDAIIATGSGNTSRYFDYYFGKYPHIIRHHRNGCAVLDGSQTEQELTALCEDMFTYFGLGCRSVSKLYLPDKYDIQHLLSVSENFSQKLITHSAYKNNYDYYKSILLINREKHLDTGGVLWKESIELASPLSMIYYEYYQDKASVEKTLFENKERIQCVVGNIKGACAFGTAQKPALWEYADELDVLHFLQKLTI
ncbi:MAG: acyl-CoA reductase [Bacteroidales bacterium]